MKNDDLTQVKKMLTALLKNQNHLWWIGGYAYGRTEGGNPFILLYASNEALKEKICRVYPRDFKKLPAFIPTDNIPQHLPSSNPNRTKAQQSGRFSPCPHFQIVTHDGKETNMGRERRFSDVLWVSSGQNPPQPPAAPSPEDAGMTVEGISTHDHWYNEAVKAIDPFMFDTALVKLESWFKDTEAAQSFRTLICGANFTPGRATTEAMLEYARVRRQHLTKDTGTAHNLAKQSAIAKLKGSKIPA